MTTELNPVDVILSALRIKRERVTGDDIAVKKRQRDELRDAINAIETPGSAPDAERLRELLGDPDDRAVRDALAAWDGLQQ
jgi:hypothetical protein